MQLAFPLSGLGRAFGILAALAAAQSVRGYQVSGVNFTTDGSEADVSAAIAAAPTGAIVKLPSTKNAPPVWGTTITITKAITVIGLGPTETVLQLAPNVSGAAFNINAAATVGNFKMLAGTSDPVNNPGNYGFIGFAPGTVDGWRITNVIWDSGGDARAIDFNGNNPGANGSYFLFNNGSYGVVDNCTINGSKGTDELMFIRGHPDSWQTPSSMGTANAQYIEDCVFNGPGYVCDANSNARVVVRFCTINGAMKIDGHGLASNTPPRGVRHMEIYGNHWTYNNFSWPAIEVRGGTGMIFNNQNDDSGGLAAYFLDDYGYENYWPNFGINITSVSPTANATLVTASPHGLTASATPIQISWYDSHGASISTAKYTVGSVTNSTTFTITSAAPAGAATGQLVTEQTPNNYPIGDQIGVGMDPKAAHSEPLYSWSNVYNGAPWARTAKTPDTDAIALYNSETGNSSFLESDLIKTDRDVFMDLTDGGSYNAATKSLNGFNGSSGVGVGLKAAMTGITPTKVGVGFWVTDEGNWNLKTGTPAGQLYVWNGSAWALHYTPFTYPHPARKPVTPTNLQLAP